MRNVHLPLPDSVIRQIVGESLPSAEFISATQLPMGSSRYSPRYLIQIRTPTVVGSEQAIRDNAELILKVCGPFWNRTIILNEVACLKLIRRNCPSFPIPRIIACSADRDHERGVGYEWILMSKLPGKTMASMKLDEKDEESIMTDLASLLTSLRSKIVTHGQIGNLLCPKGEMDEACIVVGLVDSHIAHGGPWVSFLDSYRAILEVQVEVLMSNERYRQNRNLSPYVEDFKSTVLPRLPIFADDDVNVSVLTHGDLSPSKILVARPPKLANGETLPLRISGLLDWEFSGFFSPFEEFLTASQEIIDQEQQVSSVPVADTLFKHLTNANISNPIHGFVKKHWRVARLLDQLEQNVAPWWLRECVKPKELERELAVAALVVERSIEELSEGGWETDE